MTNLLEEISEYLEVLEARDRSPLALSEASLGRIWQHYQRSGEETFGIVTSWKDVPPHLPMKIQNQKIEQNILRFKELKKLIRSWGLGFVELSGKWYRCTSTTGRSCEDSPQESREYTIVSEPSLFVPGLTKDQAENIRKTYDQDAVLWGGPEVFRTRGGGANLLTGAEEDVPLGNLVPGKAAEIYSTVRGRPFTFEWVARTRGERIMERLWGKNET